MELKQIKIDKIQANPSQPREHFDREKLKELAESILSNGLINPITVREIKNNRYEIVAGERRWKAHQLAKLNKVESIVKKYKNDIDWQIDSLVENWQREDLTSVERENNVSALWETGEFKTKSELAKRLGSGKNNIKDIINAAEFRKKSNAAGVIKTRTLTDTASMEDKERKKLLQKVEEGKIKVEDVREVVRTIKTAPEEVKTALLDDEITTEQAERISKLKTETQRTKAIKEHQDIKKFDSTVEKRQEIKMTAKQQRDLAKKLVQAGNWIKSFKNSVTDVSTKVNKSLGILNTTTKFIPVMDDRQKENLDSALDGFLEILERGEQITAQIKEQMED